MSFYDRGIPFDPDDVRLYDPLKHDIFNIDTDQLGLFLIEKIADSVKWINHGKKGKELKIILKFQLKILLK